MNIWFSASIMFALITGLAILSWYMFRHVWAKPGRLKNMLMNMSLSAFSVMFLFVALEVIFAVFVIQSDRYGFTLSSQLWFKKYWYPINSYGYRDIEHTWDDDNILFVVGDSFVAGHGINHISERFSGALQDNLGPEWTVAVLANNGWGPRRAYKALVKHPKTPKRIIVSYYINDIESAARANEFFRPEGIIKFPSKNTLVVINNSYFINWVYWRLYRGGSGSAYWDYIKQAYQNERIWKTHEIDLFNLIRYANRINSDILFVLWPNLQSIDESLPLTSKVASFLQRNNTKYVDLSRYLIRREANTLVVNKLDSHPNAVIHAEVGQLLYEVWRPWH